MVQTLFGNKTISSLTMHNKEVASIVTSNNIVLYEKESSSASVPSSIDLTTPTTILSYNNKRVFSDWTGSYTTGVDTYNYLTPSSDTLTINKTLPSEFIFRYKFYTNGNSNSGCLWIIGTDANNGVLVGHEITSQRMKIYTRSNGSNTSRYTTDNAYTNNVWTDVTITYQNQTISISMNGYTQSYALAEASYLKIYYNYNTLRLADLEIIDLSNNNVISSTSNNAILTATVTDANNLPCSNENVTFNIDGHDKATVTTNSQGIATYSYLPTGLGDIEVTAKCNNLTNSLVLEDCQYYNDGSTINGLDVKSGVSCSSDGEWITITTSTSGEKFVYPPVCYTGTDNWEVSFKCNTSNFNTQAFGLQMENCGTTTYSGDSQYTAYNGSQFGTCMGAGNKTYSLSNNDKVSFRRVNGYWRLYVNDTTEIFNRSYNWTNSRVPGFYTNNGRVQRLKEIKYKLIHFYTLEIDAPSVLAYPQNNVITGVLKDTKDKLISGEQVSLKVDNIVVDTQTTDSTGTVTFSYTPLTTGNISLQLSYTNSNDSDYNCTSPTINREIVDYSFYLSSDKNIISYSHNESCTLTLFYADNNGATVNLYNDSTDALLGTMTNNNNGTYSYTYNSNNVGDISFRAESNNQSSTKTVKDVFYYNSGAELSKMSDFNVSGRWSAKNTSAGNVTCTTDETEWLNITSSGLSNYGHIPITPLIGLNQPFKLSCIIKDANRDDRGSGGTYVSTYSGFYACRYTGGYGILLQWHPFRIPRSDKGSSDGWTTLSGAQNPVNGTYKYEVTFNGSSITHKLYYLDGSVYKTASVSVSDLNNANYSIEYGISYDNQRSFDIKDIKAELL